MYVDCVNACAASSCGTFAATASSDYLVKLFLLEKKVFEVNVMRFLLLVYCVVWSVDGKYVVVGGEDVEVKVIKMEDKIVLYVFSC